MTVEYNFLSAIEGASRDYPTGFCLVTVKLENRNPNTTCTCRKQFTVKHMKVEK